MAWTADPRDLLAVGPDFELAALDRRATPGWEDGKKAGNKYRAKRGERMGDLQEKLFANGRTGVDRSVLLVVQGLDTAGKGGIARHVAGMVDPQGLSIHSFGPPTKEELSHHYLWRIRKALPDAGKIGVFDRSHYEDVLVVRVKELTDVDWNERFEEINRFEQKLVDDGTTIIKVALKISYEEQAERLMSRLNRPDKHWKYSTSDLITRSHWYEYQAAYQDMLVNTSTDAAPWYAIPADRKWYARLSVAEILTRTLKSMDLRWPLADFDPEEEKERLRASMND